MAKYLWQRMVQVRLFKKKGGILDITAEDNANQFAIHFNIPFADAGTASTSTVTIYNLSKPHRDAFEKGCKVQVFAGYKLDTGLKLIAEGAISKINPYVLYSTDGVLEFNFQEGDQLVQAQSSAEKANSISKKLEKRRELVLGKTDAKKFKVKTHSVLSFAKGVNTNVIIRKIASDAHISIEKMKLPKPKVFKRGYVAKGRPFALIKNLANDAGAQVYRRRGKLLIDDLSKDTGKNEHILLTMHVKGEHGGTGLMQHVTFDDSSDSEATVTFKSFLRNQISTGSLITIEDPPYFTGTRRVKSGEFNCDDSEFSVTGEVYINAKADAKGDGKKSSNSTKAKSKKGNSSK